MRIRKASDFAKNFLILGGGIAYLLWFPWEVFG